MRTPNGPFLRAIPAALALLAAGAGLAAAQPDAPIAAAPSEILAEPPPPPVEPPPEPVPAPRAAVGSVEVAPLRAPGLFSAGVGDTGLPSSLWRGASAEIAREVIPTLGTRPLSPAGTALARRLLATGGEAPEGARDDAELAGARAAALLAIGDPGGAATILERTPGHPESPALSRAAAETALVLGEPDRACQAFEALKTARDQAYWLRLRAFCLAQGGKLAEAQLAFRLTTAAAAPATDAYGRLMEAKMEGAPSGAASARTALELALSRDLKLDLAPAVAAAPPPVLAVLATDPDVSPAVRLAAARAAARLGLVTADAARAADPDALAEVTAIADAPSRSKALVAWLARAKGHADFAAAARLAAPAILALPPMETAPETRVTLASAAAAAGELAGATAIRDTIERVAENPALELALLDALLAAAAGRSDTPVIDHLLERSGIGAAAARSRAAGGAALLIALADPKAEALGPRDRAELAKLDIGAGQAPPARMIAMDLAADAGLAGETGLLALSISAQGAAAGPRLADRVAIVRALTRAGLKQDASGFAVEGLLEMQGR